MKMATPLLIKEKKVEKVGNNSHKLTLVLALKDSPQQTEFHLTLHDVQEVKICEDGIKLTNGDGAPVNMAFFAPVGC